MRGYVLVEGHGEVEAAANLVSRLWADLKGPFPWAAPMRWKNLAREEGLRRGAEYVRRLGDARALLVLRDEDDRCPGNEAPKLAETLRGLALPCPTAVVLFHPEYEVLFLPCIELMAGEPLPSPVGPRPGIVAGTTWTGDWERLRGIKEWLSQHFPPNRAYKPVLDQLPMTRMLDLPTLRAANLSSFTRLERALAFLRDHDVGGVVYPSPQAEDEE